MATDILGVCCSCSNMASHSCVICGRIFCDKHFNKATYRCTECEQKHK